MLGGGGSVAIVVVLYMYHISGGTLVYALKVYLLVGMLWADDLSEHHIR